MATQEVEVKRSGVRHKTFEYRTGVRWLGARLALASSAGKPDLRLSSPPEFKGEAGVWTPEDLFVAALESCLLTTFVSFAQKRGLNLVSYESAATGTLEFLDGGYRFTRVELSPTVVLGSPEELQAAEEVLADAHAACLISNSVSAEVRVTPRLRAA